MATETVEALIEGGKASAAPPLGPALGPLGLNIGQVIADINKKTEAFKGMQVPIKIIADKTTKTWEITVGTPPASALIKKEAGVEKGSGKPQVDHVADLKIEQIIKISKMKEDNLAGKTPKDRVKEIIGTCNSMGIMVEGKHARDTMRAADLKDATRDVVAHASDASDSARSHADRALAAFLEAADSVNHVAGRLDAFGNHELELGRDAAVAALATCESELDDLLAECASHLRVAA